MFLQLYLQSRGGLLCLVLVKKQAHQVPIPVHPRQNVDDAFAIVARLCDRIRNNLPAMSGGIIHRLLFVEKANHTPLVRDRRRPKQRRPPGRLVLPCLLFPVRIVRLASLRQFFV